MKLVDNVYFPSKDVEMKPQKCAHVAKFGFFPEALADALQYVTNWSVAIDGGANIGLWTIDMAQRFEQVYSFEIDPETFNCLEENLNSREITNCTALNIGLSNCKDQYHLADGWTGNSMGRHLMPKTPKTLSYLRHHRALSHRSKDNTKITTTTIDDMNLPGLGFVKLDVEGHEAQVLEGGRETLNKYKPIVMIEYKPLLNKRYGTTDPVQILEELGASLIDKIGKNNHEWIFSW